MVAEAGFELAIRVMRPSGYRSPYLPITTLNILNYLVFTTIKNYNSKSKADIFTHISTFLGGQMGGQKAARTFDWS